jgi:hypothetical protein
MSSNLAVINFAVGGTLTVSGKIALTETVLSSSTASFQGLSTTSLTTTGTSTINGSLPTSTQTPTLDSHLTTKIYVDTTDGVVNKRITDTDPDQGIYIDASYNALNKRITDTEADQKIHIDTQGIALNKRITDTNNSIRPNRNYTIKQNADFLYVKVEFKSIHRFFPVWFKHIYRVSE